MTTLSPQEAIAALQGNELERVLSWLEAVRSIDLGAQRSHTHRSVSHQQLDALRAIECLSDDHIKALWPLDAHTARSGKHCPPRQDWLTKG